MRNSLTALVLVTAGNLAMGQIPVATYEIPVLVESAASGLFIDLVEPVAAEAHQPIRISVMPPPRAVQSFASGSQAMLFPALDVLFPVGMPIVRSKEAIDCKEDYVFTRRGTPLLSSLADLKGKRVGITRGYPYAREVSESTQYTVETANTDYANLRKLIAGRLDAFILDEKTGIRALEANGLTQQVQYDAKRPVFRQEVYYAFQNNAEGKALAERFSAALERLKRDGRYQKITRSITFANGCPK